VNTSDSQRSSSILVTGSSGLVGTALAPRLAEAGYELIPLLRNGKSDRSAKAPTWSPPDGAVDLGPAGKLRSVIHLAGAGIGDQRWSKERKKVLRESRVEATHSLATALAELPPSHRPESLIAASGMGIYGDRGDEVLREESETGTGFLADLARDWENAAEPARRAGIRVVHLRIGIVISASGGPLEKMLLPFRWGLGGPLGNGRQFVSWITLYDLVSVILTMIGREDVEGPINTIAPGTVIQREFARQLGRAIHRPALLPAPAFALRLALGEMSTLLLESQRGEPTRLFDLQFPFRYPDLATALPALRLR